MASTVATGATVAAGVVRGAAETRPPIRLGFDNFAVRAMKATARQLVDHAVAAGCSSVFITDFGPFVGRLERSHWHRCGGRVDIPIMVQDAPLMTQVAIPPALLARMGREIERVEDVKIKAPPTPAKVSALATRAGDVLTLFGGLNCQFFIEEWQRGARGQIPGSDRTRDLVEIWDHLEAAHVRHPTAALDGESLAELAHLRRLADREPAALASAS